MKRRSIKLNVTLTFALLFTFLEVAFRLLSKMPIFNISLLYVAIFIACISILTSAIVTTFGNTANKVLFYIAVFLGSFVYALEYMIFKIFGIYFDMSLLKIADQAAGFASDGVMFVIKNIVAVLIIFLPFIVSLFFIKKILIKKRKGIKNIVKVGLVVVLYIMFIISLNVDKKDINSAKSLYYNVNNVELEIRKFGVPHTFLIDMYRYIFGFEEEVFQIDKPKEIKKDDEPTEIVYKYNNLDIDFDSLIENEGNKTIKQMHEYFKEEEGTKQNEYTGFFKGKNLILFMAESFNEIAVREDITPTLYKLVHNGFVFNNFYSPTISSTIGGEFQELTGLYPASGFTGNWRAGKNSFPMGLATVFKQAGYNTFAYHDHSYTFQDRNKYLAALGFDNFLGCGNGLGDLMNCRQWPESDVSMIEVTYKDYVNSEKPFMVFYATVSGHGDYNWTAMSRKHRDEVANLPYSDKVKAYLAANIELNNALELLLEKLEEEGVLDDTVIALVGDHYPYYLTLDEVNEAATYKKDSVVEISRSNFILWNSKMEKTEINKVGSQIDVLPTLYNLYNIPYDSRLIIGKDILSTEPGLAMFVNSSWVSDKGTYFAASSRFVKKDENEEISSEYVDYMKALVTNRITMSSRIIKNDYYRKVFGDK